MNLIPGPACSVITGWVTSLTTALVLRLALLSLEPLLFFPGFLNFPFAFVTPLIKFYLSGFLPEVWVGWLGLDLPPFDCRGWLPG